MKWAYCVMTCEERRNDLLPQTLASLRAGGFDRPRLFVDGSKDILGWEQQFGLEATCRFPRLRVAGAYVMALAETFLRCPSADLFTVFQDDFVCSRNLRQYLERTITLDKFYYNCYTFPSNQTLANGRTGWYESNQLGRGAVALVFPRPFAVHVLTHPYMVSRPIDPFRGWRSVDGGISEMAKIVGWKELVHNPSLTQHTGKVSTIDKDKRSKGEFDNFPRHTWAEKTFATSFMGENYDLLELLK